MLSPPCRTTRIPCMPVLLTRMASGAALESVLPRANLHAFTSLAYAGQLPARPSLGISIWRVCEARSSRRCGETSQTLSDVCMVRADKRARLADLHNYVLGIRLFNKAIGKGGVGLVDKLREANASTQELATKVLEQLQVPWLGTCDLVSYADSSPFQLLPSCLLARAF